jgi:hypothetical protein
MSDGDLSVEVLDAEGRVLPAFARAQCVAVQGNGTRLPVTWRGGDLATLAGESVRFRFSLTKGRLYAFWVSRWATGESGGYVAAGGPGFAGPADTK